MAEPGIPSAMTLSRSASVGRELFSEEIILKSPREKSRGLGKR
jgi:hypothetical protein